MRLGHRTFANGILSNYSETIGSAGRGSPLASALPASTFYLECYAVMVVGAGVADSSQVKEPALRVDGASAYIAH